MKVSRLWLQNYFSTPLPSAQELAETLTYHAFEIEGIEEVDGDSVIDIDVLSNRSSDCLSHRGIARELATLLTEPLARDSLRDNLSTYDAPSNFSVTVDDKALCGRYMAGVVRGVRVGPSPEWLVRALSRIGQRSVNNVVDATNYVMFDLGQPIHAFDMSKLMTDPEGNRNITVRLADEGETITTLTGEEYTLAKTHQIITDGVSKEPIAIAGIKGGKTAEVTTDTVDIVVEVANFHPTIVRKASNELKLQTDASVRFQNEPSKRLCAFALKDVLQLISDITGGNVVGVCDVYQEEVEYSPIQISLEETNSLLGVQLTVDDVEQILVRLEWEFSRHNTIFAVTPPWERSDVTIKEAVIEEIGRIYGYRNVPAVQPAQRDLRPLVNVRQFYIEMMQRILSENGFSEVLTYTLVAHGEVELQNPPAKDKAFMRRSLQEGMEKALTLNANNAPLLGLSTVQLFEIGTVFTHEGERLSFCMGVKGVTERQATAEKRLTEVCEGLFTTLGYPVTCSVKNGICEIDIEAIVPLLPKPKGYDGHFKIQSNVRFHQWSFYPFMLRDVAVWVPNTIQSEKVFAVIEQHATNLMVRGDLFDTYEKEGKVSYAWHLVFQSFEKTLTDEEVNTIMQSITEALESHEGWQVR